MGALMVPHTTRVLAAVAFGLLLAGCPKPPTDLMEAANAAVLGAADSERCAEAEYRAARSLIEQANDAYNARDYDRARQLAEAAQLQAARAREIAATNAEDCDRVEEVVDRFAGADSGTNTSTPTRPILTDYEMVPIYFEFDQSGITEEARAILQRHADYLAQHPELRLQIQGHCDELGSSEYNLALGEQRARSVKAYLERLGVAADRLSTVSYGEEMPAGADQDRNRRAVFVPR